MEKRLVIGVGGDRLGELLARFDALMICQDGVAPWVLVFPITSGGKPVVCEGCPLLMGGSGDISMVFVGGKQEYYKSQEARGPDWVSSGKFNLRKFYPRQSDRTISEENIPLSVDFALIFYPRSAF